MRLQPIGLIVSSWSLLLAGCGGSGSTFVPGTADLATGGGRTNDLSVSSVPDLAMAATDDLAAASDDLGGPVDMRRIRDLAGLDLSKAPVDLAGVDLTKPDMAKAPPDLAGVDLAHTPMTITVMVGPNGTRTFVPRNITIFVGDTVKWVWASGNHNVVSGMGVADNKFCSPNDMNCANAPVSNVGANYSHLFNAAGNFPYFCKPHLNAGMVGNITVQ